MATAKERIIEVLKRDADDYRETSFRLLRINLPDVKEGTIANCLHKLVKVGVVDRVDHGRYLWMGDGDEYHPNYLAIRRSVMDEINERDEAAMAKIPRKINQMSE